MSRAHGKNEKAASSAHARDLYLSKVALPTKPKKKHSRIGRGHASFATKIFERKSVRGSGSDHQQKCDKYTDIRFPSQVKSLGLSKLASRCHQS
jgi:hypothetical protein